jgi:hypothetical protein
MHAAGNASSQTASATSPDASISFSTGNPRPPHRNPTRAILCFPPRTRSPSATRTFALGTGALLFRSAYWPGRAERGDRKLHRLAGQRLPSSDLIFRHHRHEALVRRLFRSAGKLTRPRFFNPVSSIISAKATQKGTHQPGELRSHRPWCVGPKHERDTGIPPSFAARSTRCSLEAEPSRSRGSAVFASAL